MQAIILAAGMGTRLQPLTNDRPKCMVEINGRSLLVHSLEKLAKTKDKDGNKITDVLIVCGYKGKVIEEAIGTEYCGINISYIYNKDYESTNNVYSLFLAKDWVSEDFLLLESDLLYTQSLINCVSEADNECSILVTPYNKNTMSGTVILADESDNAMSLIVKKHQNENMDLEKTLKTVNIYKFSKDFWTECFVPYLELYVKSGNLNSYYELVLGVVIYYREHDIKVLKIDESQWCEIDNMADYSNAQKNWKE